MEDQPFCFLTIKSIPLRDTALIAPTTVCAAKRRLKCAQNFARTQELPRKVKVGITSSSVYTEKSQIPAASPRETTNTLEHIFGPAYINNNPHLSHASKSPCRNSSIVDENHYARASVSSACSSSGSTQASSTLLTSGSAADAHISRKSEIPHGFKKRAGSFGDVGNDADGGEQNVNKDDAGENIVPIRAPDKVPGPVLVGSSNSSSSSSSSPYFSRVPHRSPSRHPTMSPTSTASRRCTIPAQRPEDATPSQHSIPKMHHSNIPSGGAKVSPHVLLQRRVVSKSDPSALNDTGDTDTRDRLKKKEIYRSGEEEKEREYEGSISTLANVDDELMGVTTTSSSDAHDDEKDHGSSPSPPDDDRRRRPRIHTNKNSTLLNYFQLLNDDEDNEYEEDEEKCDCVYEDPDSPTTSSDDDELNPSLLVPKQHTRGHGRSSRDPGVTEASDLRLKNEGEEEEEQPSNMVIDQHLHQPKKPGTDGEPHTEEDANALHLNDADVDALHDKNNEKEDGKQEGEAHPDHDETDETEREKEDTPAGEEDAKSETQTPRGGDFHTNRSTSSKPSSCCKSPSKKRKKKRNPSSRENDSPQVKGPVPLEPRAAVPRFPHPAVSSTATNPADEGKTNPLTIGRRARLPDLGNLLKRKTSLEKNGKDDGGRSPSGSEKKENNNNNNNNNKDPRGGRSPMSIGGLEAFLRISPTNTHKRMIQQQQQNNNANNNNNEYTTNNNRRDNTNENINLDGPAGTYATFAYLRINGKREPLPNRDHAAALLQELEHMVLIPICKHFGLRYHFFGEAHCQAKKAGMTIKDPLILKKEVPGSEGETVTELRGYQTTIRIRVRVHPSKGDPKTTFMNGGTLRAVLLHEIAHLRVMNHGKNFMLFLREVFQYAAEEIGVFKEHPPNEIPSPWPWENVIYQSLGKVSDEELIPVFDAHRAAEKAKLAKLTLEEQGKEEVKIEKQNDANNEVNQEEQEKPNEGPKTEEPNQTASNEVKPEEQDVQEKPNEAPKTEESNEANLLREAEPVESPLKPSVSRADLLALAGQSAESEEKKAPRLPFFLIEALLAMNKGPEKVERGAQLLGSNESGVETGALVELTPECGIE